MPASTLSPFGAGASAGGGFCAGFVTVGGGTFFVTVGGGTFFFTTGGSAFFATGGGAAFFATVGGGAIFLGLPHSSAKKDGAKKIRR